MAAFPTSHIRGDGFRQRSFPVNPDKGIATFAVFRLNVGQTMLNKLVAGDFFSVEFLCEIK